MAYQPQANEQAYMDEFVKNRIAIEEYKRKYGGDLEQAFQAVTGKPWPEGRSVKISNGVPEMTKDRTFGSIMGKYVLPIAAGVAAPFALPALAGGMGGVGGTLGSVGGALGKAGSVVSGLMGKGMIPGLGDIGKGIAGMADQAAKNRSETGNFIQNWDQMNLQAQQERRDSESDALKKIAQQSYVQGGGNPYNAPAVAAGQLSNFGFGPKAPSQNEIDAANTLMPQLQDRLKPGAGWKPTPYETYTKQGGWEKAGNLIGGILGMFPSGSGFPTAPKPMDERPNPVAGVGGVTWPRF